MKKRAAVLLGLIVIALVGFVFVSPILPHKSALSLTVETAVVDTGKQQIISRGKTVFNGTAAYSWNQELVQFQGSIEIDGVPLTRDPAYWLDTIRFSDGIALISYSCKDPADWPILGAIRYQKDLACFSLLLEDGTDSSGERFVIPAQASDSYADLVLRHNMIWGFDAELESAEQ